MPRSPMDAVAYTTSPDYIALILAKGWDILLAPNPDVTLINYTGLMLLHSCGFPEDNMPSCERILKSLGYTVETFPAYAIQGRCRVKSVIEYEHRLFGAESSRHGQGDNMALWQAENEVANLPLYRIEIENPETLATPILGLTGNPLTGERGIYREGDFWGASSPLELEAFKMALDKNRPILRQVGSR